MENEIHIEGYLGSADQRPSESAGKESEHKLRRSRMFRSHGRIRKREKVRTII